MGGRWGGTKGGEDEREGQNQEDRQVPGQALGQSRGGGGASVDGLQGEGKDEEEGRRGSEWNRRVVVLEKRVEELKEEVCELKAQLLNATMQRVTDREEVTRVVRMEGSAKEERLGRMREEWGRAMDAVEEGGTGVRRKTEELQREWAEMRRRVEELERMVREEEEMHGVDGRKW